MVATYLLSTLVMGLLLVAVSVAFAYVGQRATPSDYAGGPKGYAAWSDRTGESRRPASLATAAAIRTTVAITLAALLAVVVWLVLT